jgi:circadian clock protein KaiB
MDMPRRSTVARKKKNVAKKGRVAKRRPIVLELRLYIADATPRSVLAKDHVLRLCREHFAGQYRLAIIDLKTQPERARRDEILAIPTLVRVLPGSLKTVVGTFADTAHVLQGLGFGDQLENFAPIVAGAQIGSA